MEDMRGKGDTGCPGKERQGPLPLSLYLPAIPFLLSSNSTQEPCAVALAAVVHSCLVWLRTSYD